jgi:hypothetical protein
MNSQSSDRHSERQEKRAILRASAWREENLEHSENSFLIPPGGADSEIQSEPAQQSVDIQLPPNQSPITKGHDLSGNHICRYETTSGVPQGSRKSGPFNPGYRLG